MQDLRRDAPYEPGATALLFVDMQTIWAVPGLDPHHPEWPADHYFYEQLRSVTIPNQVRLLEAARAAGVEVLHTIIESLTLDGRDRSPDYVLSNIFVPKGLPEGRVIDELTPLENEIVIPKTSSGVFNSTNIEYVLRNLGIRQLIVAGTVTDQCVDMAVRDGADRGFLVTCVSDACATYTQERHDGALKAFGGYCWVADTDTVVGRLAQISATASV
jgi:nicotinamidase-related amidase